MRQLCIVLAGCFVVACGSSYDEGNGGSSNATTNGTSNASCEDICPRMEAKCPSLATPGSKSCLKACATWTPAGKGCIEAAGNCADVDACTTTPDGG